MFGIINQNLKNKQRVLIGNTSSPDLDGREATVIGLASSVGFATIYIIQLDEPVSYSDFMAITMPEVCLSPIPLIEE